MALISCPECGIQVSEAASSCPGCGCPYPAHDAVVLCAFNCAGCGKRMAAGQGTFALAANGTSATVCRDCVVSKNLRIDRRISALQFNR